MSVAAGQPREPGRKPGADRRVVIAQVALVVGVAVALVLGGPAAVSYLTQLNGSADGELAAPTADPDPGVVLPLPLDAGAPVEAEGTSVPWGRSTLADMESWVPSYPAAEYAGGNAVADVDGVFGGMFVLATDDTPSAVLAYYTRQLERAGFDVRDDSAAAAAASGRHLLLARMPAPERTMSVMVSQASGRTSISIQFQGKRE
jgi:hypothetical protein